MKLIIKLQLGRIGKRLMENHGATFSYDEAVVNEIGSRCKEVESGARNVDSILTKTVLPDLSGEFLARMAEGGDDLEGPRPRRRRGEVRLRHLLTS